MKLFRFITLSFLLPLFGMAQEKQPKLIVGIVVDQLKTEYLYRYGANFEDGGLKRMLTTGMECENNHFNYIPTYTGPGHASIFTGATPAMHGIIANNYYDRLLKKKVYCAYDATVTQTEGDLKEGQMSANRILTTTIGDEIKMANAKSKVIGISEKDRASTFPAGHMADGAYWLAGKSFITSTAYVDKLPQWVNSFNGRDLVSKYLSSSWDLLLSRDKYFTKLDDVPYEGKFKDEKAAVFPHDLPAIYKATEEPGLIKATPFGNSLTMDMAIAAIEGEDLGADENIDLLCVSFSSTDYVGHKYGTRALELEDTYYRFDKDLARLFKYLDDKIGEGNYTVFLTSDHGAAVTPGYLKENNINGGLFEVDPMKKELESLLDKRFKKGDWIVNMTDNYIFLNQSLLDKKKIDKLAVYRCIKNYLDLYPGIHRSYDRISLSENNYTDWLGSRVQNGFNAKYSPDIIYLMAPGYIEYADYGTTHGSGYTYDTHVPLLFMGYGIPKGKVSSITSITDIVPTLCTLFNIPLTSGCTGKPIPME